MNNFLWTGLTLFLFWLFLTFTLDLISFVVGIIVVVGVLWFNRDLMIDSSEADFYSLKGAYKLIRFFIILIKEIIIANIQVAKIVLDPKMPIQPSFFEYPMKLKKSMNQVIYANAITLTPGTLTVDMNEDVFIIHALTDDARLGLPNSTLEKAAYTLEDLHD